MRIIKKFAHKLYEYKTAELIRVRKPQLASEIICSQCEFSVICTKQCRVKMLACERMCRKADSKLPKQYEDDFTHVWKGLDPLHAALLEAKEMNNG